MFASSGSKSYRCSSICSLFAPILAVLLFSAPLRAATWEVTDNGDAGAGTLRQAIIDAADSDVIYFNESLDAATISLASPITITGKSLTIDAMALASGVTITGNRIFYGGAGYTLTLRGLTISDAGTAGYPALFADTATNLVIIYCSFQNNTQDLGWLWGGAIRANGDMTIANSTFHSNRPTRSQGGAIALGEEGTVRITNSTFYDNSASEFGGVIYVESPKKLLYITHSTFAENDNTYGGSAIRADGGAKVWLKNNIFWNNGASDDFSVIQGSTVISEGYNIFHEDPSGVDGFDEAVTDIINSTPGLGSLAANSGRTQTTLPGDGGSVDTNRIPHGTSGCSSAPDADQRGVARGAGTAGACTIGAVELDAASNAAATTLQSRTMAVVATGSGTVTSSPGDINCGGTCSSTFLERNTVTLTATPDFNFYTIKWSGCDYNPTFDTCVVTALHADSDIHVTLSNPGLTYSKISLPEAATNDGGVSKTAIIDLFGESFTGSNSDDFVDDGKVTVTNIAEGLTAEVLRLSDTQAELRFSGHASSHGADDSITNVTIAFQDSAFLGADAGGVADSTRSDLTLRFYDANLSYSPTAFSEASTSDGAVFETVKINLFGDSFSDPLTGTYEATNVPAGLTLVVERDSDTQATVYFTGHATSHGTDDSRDDVSVTFQDAAFTGGGASSILGTTSPNLDIFFFDGSPSAIRELTYFATGLSEGSGNNGAVPGVVSLSLYGDHFTGVNGQDFISENKIAVANLPPGLTAVATRTSASSLALSFGGTASDHRALDSVSNLTFVFQNSAFAGNDATVVTGYNTDDLAINFDNPPTHTVTTNAGSSGSIAPNNPDVFEGDTVALTVTPNTGYSIDSVTGCAGTLVDDTYTTGAITSACTVAASFSLNSYTVNTSAGANGSIDASSAVVSHGDTASFVISPDTGYSIDSVSGCAGTLVGDTYTTGAIVGPCTVMAGFGGDGVVAGPGAPTGKTSVRSGGGGSTGAGALILLLLLCIRRHLNVVVTMLLCAVSSTALSAETDFYGGVQVGRATTDIRSDDVIQAMAEQGINGTASIHNGTRNAWKLFAGYQHNEHFALEAGYIDLGTVTTELEGNTPITIDDLRDVLPTSGSGMELTAVGRYAFTERFGIYGRIGIWNWKADYNLHQPDGTVISAEPTGTDTVFGLGTEIRLTPTWRMRLGWDRYGVDVDDASLYSIGVVYQL